MNLDQLKVLLDAKVKLYNKSDFITLDPISIPKQYSKKQDIEITGFWTAMLAWGQRKTIINKSTELFELMDNDPHNFILNHKESDRKAFLDFKHRTFNTTDTLYFLEWLQFFYKENESLESAFLIDQNRKNFDLKLSFSNFNELFFSLPEYPRRTQKHIANPMRNSSCKRLNMFLRWMVRRDKNGVDFGIWKNIPKSKLYIPLDVHVHKVALRLGLTKRKQSDWKTLEEIMSTLQMLDPKDPSKYDYALFGMGILDGLDEKIPN